MVRQVFAQGLQQRRIFGKTFHEDLARAVKRRFRIGHAGIVTGVRRKGGP